MANIFGRLFYKPKHKTFVPIRLRESRGHRGMRQWGNTRGMAGLLGHAPAPRARFAAASKRPDPFFGAWQSMGPSRSVHTGRPRLTSGMVFSGRR